MPLAALPISILLTLFGVYALFTGHFVGDQLHVWKGVWGLYVWADAYSGFILMSTLIYAYQRRLGVTGRTGDMVAIWLLRRGPDLYRRISRAVTAPA